MHSITFFNEILNTEILIIINFMKQNIYKEYLTKTEMLFVQEEYWYSTDNITNKV